MDLERERVMEYEFAGFANNFVGLIIIVVPLPKYVHGAENIHVQLCVCVCTTRVENTYIYIHAQASVYTVCDCFVIQEVGSRKQI